MEWLLLALLSPLVLAPVVLMFGYAGCGVQLTLYGAPPSAVTSLTAERTGDRIVRLKWAHPDAGVLFRISRGESAGAVLLVPALQDISGTEAEDVDLPEGTTFFYEITAVASGATSLPFTSGESVVTTRPAAPSDLVVTPVGDTVVVSWKNNSAKAKRFTLERAGAKIEPTLAPGAPLAYTDAGLTSGTTYEYKIRAFVDGLNKGLPERVDSEPEVKASITFLSFKPVFPPSATSEVPLTTDQAAPGFCFVQRIGADRLLNSGTKVRVTFRGSLTGSLNLTTITISHAVPAGEAWDSVAPVVLLATNVVLPAGKAIVLGPVDFALDEAKPLLIAFDVSATPGEGNVRYALLNDPQTKMYYKQATQQALFPNRTSDFLTSNSLYCIEKIEAVP